LDVVIHINIVSICPCKIVSKLGVSETPPIELVLKHWENILDCNAAVDQAKAVIEKIYEHLNPHPERISRTWIDSLAQKECVMLQDHSIWIQPCHLFFEIEDTLEPYIYKVPRPLMRFEKLLMALGVREKPAIGNASQEDNISSHHYQKMICWTSSERSETKRRS